MSDCSVCLYYDGDYAQVFNKKEPRAAKPHKCSECDREIIRGEKYQRVKMLFEGEWSTYDTCLVCAEIREAFSCNGEQLGGMLWEDMREQFFPEMNTGCLEKLTTAAAKAEVVRRWNEWKLPRRP